MTRRYTPPPVADLPFDPASTELSRRLLRSLDVEGKILHALEALGPVGGRDVVLLGGGPVRARQLQDIAARVTEIESWAAGRGLPGDSADVIVAYWSGFRAAAGSTGPDAGRREELRKAERILRNDGRLLIVHDYGRDDVSGLRGDLPEYSSWSRRDGWFLRSGFRIRVVHTAWTFDTLEEVRSFVEEAFGSVGGAILAGLTRPRLSYNVAVYHRVKGGA
jgi:hypothetical protein